MAYMALRLAGPALHRAGALAVREEVVLNSLGRFTTLLGREFGPPEIWSSASLQSKALPPICLPATPPICSPASFPEAQPPVSSPAVPSPVSSPAVPPPPASFPEAPSPVSSPAVPSPEGPSLRRCFPEVTSSTQVQAPGRPPEFPGTTPVPAPGCPPEFPGATPAQTPTSSPDRLAPYGGVLSQPVMASPAPITTSIQYSTYHITKDLFMIVSSVSPRFQRVSGFLCLLWLHQSSVASPVVPQSRLTSSDFPTPTSPILTLSTPGCH
ncbi:leucine-rich repeat extensin-like protein 5 isoform X1 [Siniperca chuatsi]|uniref:leucine-rich repeat extensin-like protein 5 isoform X1 n=1 Tax=Siniperca chuatsi TaxID=119488 RepID=UPI001CE21E6F|nr:leucine-rich repeat extensin-like protein 5 isoform X1 [Siniperca chuatsi]